MKIIPTHDCIDHPTIPWPPVLKKVASALIGIGLALKQAVSVLMDGKDKKDA